VTPAQVDDRVGLHQPPLVSLGDRCYLGISPFGDVLHGSAICAVARPNLVHQFCCGEDLLDYTHRPDVPQIMDSQGWLADPGPGLFPMRALVVAMGVLTDVRRDL
jgi:hypothetical protein